MTTPPAKRGEKNTNGGRIGLQMPPPAEDGDGKRKKRGVTHTVTAVETVTADTTDGLAGRALQARETPSSTCTSTTTTTTYVCAQETTSQNEGTTASASASEAPTSSPPTSVPASTSASEVTSSSCADTSTSSAEVGESLPSEIWRPFEGGWLTDRRDAPKWLYRRVQTGSRDGRKRRGVMMCLYNSRYYASKWCAVWVCLRLGHGQAESNTRPSNAWPDGTCMDTADLFKDTGGETTS